MKSFEVVDAFLPYAIRLAMDELEGTRDPQLCAYVERGMSTNMRHFVATNIIRDLATEYGGIYRPEPDPTAVIDTTPGNGIFCAYNEFDPAEASALLHEYAPEIVVPMRIDAITLRKDPDQLDIPFVLKDTNQHKGLGKLLVNDEQQSERVISFLKSVGAKNLVGIVAEEYIQNPSKHPVSFRITATPDGGIISANLNYALDETGEMPISKQTYGTVLGTLGNPKSPYFIDARTLGSNNSLGGMTLPLAFSRTCIVSNLVYGYPVTNILEDYEINKDTLELPAGLEQASMDIARILGPKIGLLIGLDLMLDDRGRVVFLEANSSPDLENVRASMGLPGFWTDERIYLYAVRMMFSNLEHARKR